MKRRIVSVRRVVSAVTLILSLSVSCSEKGSGGEQASPVSTLEPLSVGPLSATLGGSIQNYSIGEITRGELGILLSEVPSDQSQDQSRFLEWKNTGSAEGIKVFRASHSMVVTDFSVEIKELVPDTPYLACAFFIDKNGNRMIGHAIRFITTGVKLLSVTERVESPGYINASICGTVRTNLPFDNMSYGIIWSDTPGQTTLELGHAVSGRKIDEQNGSYSVNVNYLHAGTPYYYRSYVKYNGEYSYGEELIFTTRDADEMAVDLGLSVLWADCNLGATSWEEDGLALAWGELIENKTGNKLDYSLYVNGDYVDIGTDISGTEYDAAHVYLGGKWRMPTREEFSEFEKCRIVNELIGNNKFTLIGDCDSLFFANYCGYVFSNNTQKMLGITLWTSTVLSEKDPEYATSNNHPLYINKRAWSGLTMGFQEYSLLGKEIISWNTRESNYHIRPVRDRD